MKKKTDYAKETNTIGKNKDRNTKEKYSARISLTMNATAFKASSLIYK